MVSLEDLVPGSIVSGIEGNLPVTIVAIKWYGNAVIEVTFKDTKGHLSNQLLYREDEENLKITKDYLPWNFDVDAGLLRLVSEAYRIKLAHIFDPYLAVHTSSIDPLPHQISAVYRDMLPKLPLRYILADDPGSGKTIMTGLYIKELLLRGDLKRCMIVTPGNLAEQWQDELFRKFSLRFEILNNERIENAVTGNIFNEVNLCIMRLDKLSRNISIQEKLSSTDWDLIVCDEAHKMSATVWSGEIKYTKRFQLGRLLSQITKNFLLLTATPHNGKEEDFQLFMSLIDQDRFEGVVRSSNRSVDVSDVMRRLVKEELLKFDGTPLFPERLAYTVNYDLSPNESLLYIAVTDYVQEEFNRADKLNGERKTTVGFALTILQRRLASSPEAIYQSLKRRREKLEFRLSEEKVGKRGTDFVIDDTDGFDEDDYSSKELESVEELVAYQASAATTINELEAEISILKKLEKMANDVRISGVDRKWDELSKLLQDNEKMFGTEGVREKLIIFTEHRDTLQYLSNKIRSLLGSGESVVNIHGGLLRDDRRKIEELFKQDKDVRVLIATDAAGEGINLQRAHLMVNYDLPWNPNRLEQRFGRIHRIGQTEVCHLWNLVSKETREGMVFQRLFEKLEQERETLNGKVFDILGKVTFDNKPLRELLIEAVRYGNDPEVRAKLNQVVDNSIERESLQKLIDDHALTNDAIDVSQVITIREDMERMEAHKLQPHFIESFFLEAFTSIGGKIRPREDGRFEIIFVPQALRNRDLHTGYEDPLLSKYERICFDKKYTNLQGHATASLIVPGHTLLDATIDLIQERYGSVLKRGAIFVDENDYSKKIRVLFYIEDSVQDGILLQNGEKRVISKHVHFVEINSDGLSRNAGYAPYLDYRALKSSELNEVNELLKDQLWLKNGIEDIAISYAIENIVPNHLSEVKRRKIKIIDKTTKAVKNRLISEIQYWDFRASDLKLKEITGKSNAKLNSQIASKRAEELELRLQNRLSYLDKERKISATPPVIIGGAIVLPIGLLKTVEENLPTLFSINADERKRIEKSAMETVIEIEKSLGNIPVDVSSLKCGYDIESKRLSSDTIYSSILRFIEVKGRAKGSTTVTVSKNEILTALNKPDEYLLAIVEVDDNLSNCIYLSNPFNKQPDFAATSVNYSIDELIANSKVVLEREIYVKKEAY